MSHTIRMNAIVEVDFEDFEECIAKDYRHYVKLKSCDEPYEVDEDTYERVLAWIDEANAKREELRPCAFCSGRARFEMRDGTSLGIVVEHEDWCQIHDRNWFCCGNLAFDTTSDAGKLAVDQIKIYGSTWWNRRAE